MEISNRLGNSVDEVKKGEKRLGKASYGVEANQEKIVGDQEKDDCPSGFERLQRKSLGNLPESEPCQLVIDSSIGFSYARARKKVLETKITGCSTAPAVLLALARQRVFRGFEDTTTPLYATGASLQGLATNRSTKFFGVSDFFGSASNPDEGFSRHSVSPTAVPDEGSSRHPDAPAAPLGDGASSGPAVAQDGENEPSLLLPHGGGGTPKCPQRWAAGTKAEEGFETHLENPLSMTGSGSVNPFSGLSTTNPPGTVVSFLPGLPSATPAPPATAALISFGPVPGYHPISASLTPSPPAPLNPLPGGSLQTPAIGSCPRFFEVPHLLGPSVAPTAPDLTDGASSSRPIVLDSDNEEEEENALDLNLKL
ncbi:hypothetical protein ACET3Z_017998 [Daucus carota]